MATQETNTDRTALGQRPMSRKEFLAGAGALVVGFSMLGTLLGQTVSAASPASAKGGTAVPLPPDLATTPTVDSWLKVDRTGAVTVLSGKVDLGQGIGIALEQIVADELYVPLSQVSIIMGDTALTPNEGYTAGSTSIAIGGMSLRWAAAAARQKLLELASAKFNVPASSLKIANGVITAPGGKSVTYGTLIGGKKFDVTVTAEPPLKPYQDYTIVGTSQPRLTIPAIATASEGVYVQNLRLPGMLYARVLFPPSPGAELLSLDESVALKVPGVVKVVRNGSFVGVIAKDEWGAISGMTALQGVAKWGQTNVFPDAADIPTYLQSALHSDVKEVVTGSVEDALRTAHKRVDAVYTVPYLSHGSIGPSAAIGLLDTDGNYTIWTHTQGPFPDQSAISYMLGVPTTKVRVIHVDGAGCYGHNGADDAAADAALLAQAMPGHPISVQWMRDNEFQWEPYGTAMVLRLQGGLDAKGNITAWNQDIWGGTFSTRPGPPGWLLPGWYLAQPQLPGPPALVGTDRNEIPYYQPVANQRIYCHYVVDSPLRVSAHRTLGAFRNEFAIESFMDELAYASGQDPLAFRLRNLNDPRATAVLQTAARKAGWVQHTKPSGRGLGVAFTRYEDAGAYVGMVADVTVDRSSGTIRVNRITVAADVGQIINPNGLRNQAEGGAIQATSWTLKEEVTWNRQAIASVDWVTYPILTFPEVPMVDVTAIDHPEYPPAGFGEAAAVPTGAAIANAVFDATGARLRDLPLKPEKVKAALA